MEIILMGIVAAFAAFTLLTYVLILIGAPVLIIPVFLVTFILLIKPVGKIIKKMKFKLNKQMFIIVSVFILGIVGQLSIISPSGVSKNDNLLFWSANGHDGAWHIALMNEIGKGWPFQNPVFAGEKLVNYHYFSDILPAVIGKYVPGIDINLYFRIFPFFYSLLLGASAYFLTKKLSNNSNAPIWATIFTYFAGSFGFIVTYIKGKTIGGESIFWATQPQSASGNPPQIVSGFLLLGALYFLISLEKEQNHKKRAMFFAICVLLFGILVEFKVYAAVVALTALGIVGLVQILRERKFTIILIAILSSILSIVLYFPNSTAGASFLIFQPWWYIRTMVVEPSRLNWLDLELRRQFYLARGGIRSILRITEYEGTAFLIFFFGNLGMRFLGIINFLKTRLIIQLIIIISFVLPLIFLQKGVASNTSQFLQYFVLLFGILAGIETSKITTRFKFLIPIILLMMIPTQIGLIYEFYSRPAFAKISVAEIQALNYLKQNTPKNSVILTPPYNQYLDLKDTTPNIWDWFDTSYVSALSDRRTFFDDYEQADIMGYNYKPRFEAKRTIFESNDQKTVKSEFLKTKADILYYPKVLSPKLNPGTYGLTKMFENDEVEIWKSN